MVYYVSLLTGQTTAMFTLRYGQCLRGKEGECLDNMIVHVLTLFTIFSFY